MNNKLLILFLSLFVSIRALAHDPLRLPLRAIPIYNEPYSIITVIPPLTILAPMPAPVTPTPSHHNNNAALIIGGALVGSAITLTIIHYHHLTLSTTNQKVSLYIERKF